MSYVVVLEYANTVDRKGGVFYAVGLMYVNMVNEKHVVFCVMGLEYANTVDRKQLVFCAVDLKYANMTDREIGVKNAEGPIYAKVVGVILEETENMRVIVCPAL